MVTNNAVNMIQVGQTMYNGAGVWTQGAVPGSHNIGIAYAGGTFTVQGSDGTALSAANPGYVILQSKATPGRLATILVTANQTFTDGSAGTTDNARFGLTTGVNWAQDVPFFLYGVMDDTETLINFMISRNPAAVTSPASTSISKTGAIINVNQADFFSLGSITVTSYDSNPCICLGAFRMQFTGATDHWTVQALSTADGIGRFHKETWFLFPSGQNGAAASTYFLAGAGTEPQFTENNMMYSIKTDGFVDYLFRAHICTVGGVGAQEIGPVLPYAGSSTANQTKVIFTWMTTAGASFLQSGVIVAGAYTPTELRYGAGGTTNFTVASIIAGDSYLSMMRYKAYG